MSLIASLLLIFVISLTLEESAGAKSSDLTVKKGETLYFPYENLQKIIIEDEGIVDVKVDYSNRKILITGKEPGETALTFFAPGGKNITYQVRVLKKEVLSKTKTASPVIERIPVNAEKQFKDQEDEIKRNSKLSQLEVHVTGDRISLQGEVYDESSKLNAEQIAGSYGKKVVNLIQVVRPMIEMDVKIVQIDTEKGESFGDNLLQNLGITLDGSVGTDSQPRISISTSALTALHLLVNHGRAKILSEPHLTCRSGEHATFHSGGEIGFRVSGRGNTGVKFKEYGLILQIEPRIDDKGMIASLIHLEVSSPTSAPTSSQDIGFSKFNAESHIVSQPDETIIIAGLAENIEHFFGEKTPLLGSIPVLNLFFSQKQDQRSRKDLLMMVTPTLARVERNEGYHSLAVKQKDALKNELDNEETLPDPK